MEMHYVDSSNIECIGYDGGSSTLRIEFKKSGTYEYYGVPEHVFNEFRGASSVGTYHAREIKPIYPCSKV